MTFALRRKLALTLSIIGVGCLLAAPHLAVTRISHCGMLVTLHMMEQSWTVVLWCAAAAGMLAALYQWSNALALCGFSGAAFAVYLLVQINSWYSYQAAPAELDLMALVFGHVVGIALPLAIAGGALIMIASAVSSRR